MRDDFGLTRIVGEMRKRVIKISCQTIRRSLMEHGIAPCPNRTSDSWVKFLNRLGKTRILDSSSISTIAFAFSNTSHLRSTGIEFVSLPSAIDGIFCTRSRLRAAAWIDSTNRSGDVNTPSSTIGLLGRLTEKNA